MEDKIKEIKIIYNKGRESTIKVLDNESYKILVRVGTEKTTTANGIYPIYEPNGKRVVNILIYPDGYSKEADKVIELLESINLNT